MTEYVATLQYSRFYTIELEAEDIQEAKRIADRYAELEDIDVNNGETIYVVGVERVDEDVE